MRPPHGTGFAIAIVLGAAFWTLVWWAPFKLVCALIGFGAFHGVQKARNAMCKSNHQGTD